MSKIKVIALAVVLAVSASSAFASPQKHSHGRRIQSDAQLIEGRNSAAQWGSYIGSMPTGRDAMVNALGN